MAVASLDVDTPELFQLAPLTAADAQAFSLDDAQCRLERVVDSSACGRMRSQRGLASASSEMIFSPGAMVGGCGRWIARRGSRAEPPARPAGAPPTCQ